VSLTLGWFLGRAADLTNIKRGSFHDEAGLEFPVNAEHPDQRAALLAAFNGLGTQATLEAILAKLVATPATAAAQETQRVLLAQIASALATEGGYLDGVEGLLGTSNTSLAAIVTALAATLKVQTPIPAGVVVGQAAVTTSATALPAAALVNGIVVKAAASNTATIWIGGSGVTTSANGYPLAPGEAMSFAVANASALYLISTAAGVAYFGGN
jgi:hypothetical protein